jgi:hypothetical protein
MSFAPDYPLFAEIAMKQYMFAARAPSERARPDSERKSTETPADLLDTALARVARLEMTLAATGGALHDVNNLLTVLSGNLYLMTEELRAHPEALNKSRSARNTAERASALIRELLSSAKDTDDSVDAICPAQHVLAMEPLLRRSIGTRHTFSVKHSDDPWRIAASAAQLQSAVANLVINAREALSDRGAIQVQIENVELDRATAKKLGLAAVKYVRLSVIDTGAGIPKELLPRVTEPLVSSKSSGHGNGMGLSMVKRFAEQAGGELRIASVVGHGTRVDLWLPRCLQSAATTANMTLPLSTLPSGNETVLVFTNDTDVSGIVQQLLDALGYTVIMSTSRPDALRKAKKHSDIALVVCERSIDDRDEQLGWLKALRRFQPKVRQLAVLGLGEDGATVAPDADATVHRPVPVAELASALRSALEVRSCQ